MPLGKHSVLLRIYTTVCKTEIRIAMSRKDVRYSCCFVHSEARNRSSFNAMTNKSHIDKPGSNIP